MSGIRYYSMDEAADALLGWKGRNRGRKLRRLVLRKEKEEGREIAIRNGSTGGTHWAWMQVTESMMRLHFPELFQPAMDALAQEIHRRIDDLKTTLGAEIDERIAPQVQVLRSQHKGLAKELARLAEGTNDGFSRIERRFERIEGILEVRNGQK